MEEKKPVLDIKIQRRKERIEKLKKILPVKTFEKIKDSKPYAATKEKAKNTWDFFDGKKTALGLVVTAAGVGMTYVPILNFASTEVMVTGAGMLVTGLGFKAKKGELTKAIRFLLNLLKSKKK